MGCRHRRGRARSLLPTTWCAVLALLTLAWQASASAQAQDECLADLPEWLLEQDYRFKGHVRLLEAGRFRLAAVDGLELPLPDDAIVEVRSDGRSMGIDGESFEASVMRIDAATLTANVAAMGDGYRTDPNAPLVGQVIQYLGHVDRECRVPKRFYTAALTLAVLLDPQGAERVDVRIARDIPGLLVLRHFTDLRVEVEVVVDDPATLDGWISIDVRAPALVPVLRDL
jgi:hypothetical protein